MRIPKPTVAPDPSRPHLLGPNEFLSPSQLHEGMKGYGLTVLQGNHIEKFDVAILGVVKKANNGRDLILVKLGGPTLRRVSDIIAGMSGSPVYVQGKIIGAVAYGAQFTRESIGYVTPIEDMLDAWDPSLPQNPNDDMPPASPATALSTPVTIGGKTYQSVQIAARETRSRPGVLSLRPLATKVTISGVSGPRFTQAAKELAELGLEARQGGGAAAAGTLKGSPMQPGGAIAMSLATGDIDITGIGTLTYRRGNRIVAFGHPFLGIGPVQAPMFTAYIHEIEPSFSESHKIGSPVSLVGTFFQDRPYSIGGQIGPKPDMLPITVQVRDRMMGRSRTFRAKLLRHPILMSRLVNMAVAAAIGELHGQPGEATATVSTTVETEGYGTIQRTNRVQDSDAIESVAAEDLKNALAFLTSNSYGRVSIRSIKMDVDITPGKQAATVERLFLKQSRYEPGDTVEIGVVLKPYKKPEQVHILKMTLPVNMPTGTHLLTVQGGPTGYAQTGLLAAFMGRSPDYSGTASVAQMIRRYNERERNDTLVARLNLPTSSLLVKGEKLEGLPPNIEAAIRMGAARSTGARLERDDRKVTEQTDWVLTGSQTLPIRVVKKGQVDLPIVPSGATTTNDTTTTSTPAPQGNTNSLSPQSTADDEDFRNSVSTPRLESRFDTASLTEDPPQKIPAASPQTKPTTPDATNTATRALPASTTTPIGRQPGVFRHAGGNDFRTGTREGIALTSQGTLQLAARLTCVAESSEPYFWCTVTDGSGGVYAGSGDSGKIYHVTTEGKCILFAETGELEVHALLRTADGSLYAGTSPQGRVFRIGADGKAERVMQADARFVLGLAQDAAGENLYIATGGSTARVYNLPLGRKGEAAEIYHSEESSVSALTIAPDGSVYVGTSPNALVVRIAGPKGATLVHPEVVYDATETAISGLAVDKNGVVFASTAPRGVLYRIAPGAAPRVLLDRPPGNVLNGLLQAADGTLYAASGSTVLAIHPESGLLRSIEAPTDIQVLNLNTDSSGRLWAATASVGGVYTLDSEAKDNEKGTFTSSVLDAKGVAQWGTLRYQANLPAGSHLGVQTRSGNTLEPDTTWSDWSQELSRATGETIASPPARYLQYRVVLAGPATATTAPALQSLEAFYLPPNQAPQVTLLSPRGGEVWHGTKIVRWTASDPDRDTLTSEVLLSADGGKTWQPAPTTGKPATTPAAAPVTVTTPTGTTTIKTAPPTAPVTPTPDNSSSALSAIQAELDKHPEMSPEMRARILADAPQQLGHPGNETPRTAEPAPGARDTSLPLDTSRLADGMYLLKVVTNDRSANPTNGLSTEAVSTPFQVVNRPPVLSLLDKNVLVQTDKTVRLQGVAMHPAAGIRAVQFRVDNGEWQSATANDGIFDSLLEAFTLTTSPLSNGRHTIEVQAFDEAGNTTTQKTSVSVN